MKNFTLSLLIFAALLMYGCSNSTGGDDGGDTEPPVDQVLWEEFQYEETPILNTFSTDENLYSFTGFEIFKTDLDGSNPEQINALNDRSIFFADGNSLFSISDSTILISDNEAASFDTLIIESFAFRSALKEENTMFASSENGMLIKMNLTSQEIDTLYESGSDENIRLISLVDENLFVNVNNSVRLFITDEPTEGFLNPGFQSSSTFEVIEVPGLDVLFAATRFNKVLRSENDGENWSGVFPENLPANPVTDLFLTENGRLYIAINGSGAYYTDDFGDSWSSVTDTVLNTSIYSFTETADDEFLANTESGIFIATFDYNPE